YATDVALARRALSVSRYCNTARAPSAAASVSDCLAAKTMTPVNVSHNKGIRPNISINANSMATTPRWRSRFEATVGAAEAATGRAGTGGALRHSRSGFRPSYNGVQAGLEASRDFRQEHTLCATASFADVGETADGAHRARSIRCPGRRCRAS